MFVDVIKRIEILTTNRQLYRDEVDSIEIQAYDPQGTATHSESLRHWLLLLLSGTHLHALSLSLSLARSGNLFTTLEGLEFQWSIFPASMQPSDMVASMSRGTSVLTFQAFKESTVDVSPSLLEMEAQGKSSWLVLVRGIDTGKANIAARLVAIGYDVRTLSLTRSLAQARGTASLLLIEALRSLVIVPAYRTYHKPRYCCRCSSR